MQWELVSDPMVAADFDSEMVIESMIHSSDFFLPFLSDRQKDETAFESSRLNSVQIQ
jgi:hypothetical protein